MNFIIKANINNLGNLDLGTLECNETGNFQAAAETLDDLAKLIEDVGLENLCNQLDLDIDCGLGLTRNVGFARSSDIVQETRAQANPLKKTLRSLSSIPGATKIVNRVINDINNVCLNDVEEAIEAIETGATIVENAGPEINQLIKSVEAFQKLTDTPSVVREAANILQLLETVIPKLAPANPKVCGASNAQAFGSLRGLAVLVDELSSNTKITGLQTRQELKNTAKTISGVTSFLTKLNKAFTKFDKFCTSDKEYNVEAITAIGEMMTDLADLFAILGGISDAEEIRKQGDFTNKVVVSRSRLIWFIFSFNFCRRISISLEAWILDLWSATKLVRLRWLLKLWKILPNLLMMLELKACAINLIWILIALSKDERYILSANQSPKSNQR